MATATTPASFLDIADKHVFITGAAGGIGLAVVEEFLGMTWTERFISILRD